MSVEQNKQLYRRFIQGVFSEGRIERVRDFAAPNYAVREAPTASHTS